MRNVAPRPGSLDHGDVAAALLDDAVDDRQAEAGAFALLLGREERLEQLGARLLVDAGAGVADAQPRVAAGAPFDVRDRCRFVELDFVDAAPSDDRPRASRRAR